MHSCMCSYIHAIYNIRTHTHTHPYKQCIHRKHSETGILAIPDVHVYTHTCMRAYIHIHECVHTYIYMNACMLIYIHRRHSETGISVILGKQRKVPESKLSFSRYVYVCMHVCMYVFLFLENKGRVTCQG